MGKTKSKNCVLLFLTAFLVKKISYTCGAKILYRQFKDRSTCRILKYTNLPELIMPRKCNLNWENKCSGGSMISQTGGANSTVGDDL